MPVQLTEMRELLLPGLDDFTTNNLLVKAYERYSFGMTSWTGVFGNAPKADVLPVLGPKVALVLGATAAVVRNPEVSRRGLLAFLRKKENTNG